MRLKVYPEAGTLFDMLWRQMVHGSPELAGVHTWLPELLLSQSPVLRLLTEKPVLAIMPYDLKIR